MQFATAGLRGRQCTGSAFFKVPTSTANWPVYAPRVPEETKLVIVCADRLGYYRRRAINLHATRWVDPDITRVCDASGARGHGHAVAASPRITRRIDTGLSVLQNSASIHLYDRDVIASVRII